MVCLDWVFKVLKCHQFIIKERNGDLEGFLSFVLWGFRFVTLLPYSWLISDFLLDVPDQRQEKLFERLIGEGKEYFQFFARKYFFFFLNKCHLSSNVGLTLMKLLFIGNNLFDLSHSSELLCVLKGAKYEWTEYLQTFFA